MKIGLTGASGFLGTRLIDGSNRLAHRVIAFTRHPKHFVSGSIETRRYSLRKPLDLSSCDAVVHFAGESILGPWTRRKKKRILESRVLGTRHVVDSMAAAKEKPGVFICASGIGIYGDTGEAEVDESVPTGSGFLADVCQQWEAEAMRAETLGIRTVVLRLGLVIGRNGGIMSLLRPMFRLGLGATLGSGRQWMSWVHVTDITGLTLYSIENSKMRGVYNCVSPNPCRNADFSKALAQKFNRPVFFSMPEWLLKKTLGDLASVVLSSQRVVARRLQGSGFTFRYTQL